nr:MAG TPA: hypothetical protein [Caudoviricetes sp.]
MKSIWCWTMIFRNFGRSRMSISRCIFRTALNERLERTHHEG